ncbi:MAG: hypothetical protein Q4A15_02435 [Prevotellaceae bacterium]|nr:hypothetical protein [Prevotellaceae bacterium]
MASKNPKTYVTLLDLDSELSFRNYPNHRNSYSKRFLDHFYPNIDSKRDRIVLLYNMIDVSRFGSIHGCSNINGARNDAKQHYPDLFNRMKVPALAGFTHLDNFVFKTFCTGIFSKVVNNNGKHYQTYNEATDEYPKELWGEITRRW